MSHWSTSRKKTNTNVTFIGDNFKEMTLDFMEPQPPKWPDGKNSNKSDFYLSSMDQPGKFLPLIWDDLELTTLVRRWTIDRDIQFPDPILHGKSVSGVFNGYTITREHETKACQFTFEVRFQPDKELTKEEEDGFCRYLPDLTTPQGDWNVHFNGDQIKHMVSSALDQQGQQNLSSTIPFFRARDQKKGSNPQWTFLGRRVVTEFEDHYGKRLQRLVRPLFTLQVYQPGSLAPEVKETTKSWSSLG